jgi:hypothetical protein
MGRLKNNGGKIPTGDIAKLGPPPETGSNDARQRDLDDPRHTVDRRRSSLLAGQAGPRVTRDYNGQERLIDMFLVMGDHMVWTTVGILLIVVLVLSLSGKLSFG